MREIPKALQLCNIYYTSKPWMGDIYMYMMWNEKTADVPCASLSFARSYRKKSIRTALIDVVASE